MVHVHKVNIYKSSKQTKVQTNEQNFKQRNFFRKVMRKQGKEPVQANRPEKVYIMMLLSSSSLFVVVVIFIYAVLV